MFISTLTKAFSPRRVAMLALVAAGAMMASAQTFVADGVIWKASGNKLTAQKAGTKVTTGEAGPTVYAGDIVINAQIEYGGKTYRVSSIGSVFKDSEITSITIADGVATISRGCFSGCKNLKTVKFPADLTTFNGNMFENCTALEEFEIPGAAKEIASNQFKNCSSLRKLVIADGATALELSAGAFTVDEGVTIPLEEVVINRAIGNKYTAMDTKPFRGAKALKKVTIGGSCVSLPASYFENSTLETVVFESAFTTLNTNVFAATNISEITLPDGVTSIPASLMQNCKQLKKVTLGSAVESIGDMAFYNSTVSEVALPASLKSIGQMLSAALKSQVTSFSLKQSRLSALRHMQTTVLSHPSHCPPQRHASVTAHSLPAMLSLSLPSQPKTRHTRQTQTENISRAKTVRLFSATHPRLPAQSVPATSRPLLPMHSINRRLRASHFPHVPLSATIQ